MCVHYSLEEKKIQLEDYDSANMTDVHKIPFDYCLDINSWQQIFFDLFDLLMTLTSVFDLGVGIDTFLLLDAPSK